MTRAAHLLRRVDAYSLWAFNPPRAHLSPEEGAPRPGATTRESGDVVGDVIDTIAHLLASEQERTRSRNDPVLALRDTERLRRGVMDRLEELHADNPQAVRALRRRGWSFARIAEQTGLSTRHVAELARLTHRRTSGDPAEVEERSA